jgi:hypothetical protein
VLREEEALEYTENATVRARTGDTADEAVASKSLCYVLRHNRCNEREHKLLHTQATLQTKQRQISLYL